MRPRFGFDIDFYPTIDNGGNWQCRYADQSEENAVFYRNAGVWHIGGEIVRDVLWANHPFKVKDVNGMKTWEMIEAGIPVEFVPE